METKARLDRPLAFGKWVNRFPSAMVEHISTSTSDHSLLLIHFCTTTPKPKHNSFRFEPMWIRSEDFSGKDE